MWGTKDLKFLNEYYLEFYRKMENQILIQSMHLVDILFKCFAKFIEQISIHKFADKFCQRWTGQKPGLTSTTPEGLVTWPSSWIMALRPLLLPAGPCSRLLRPPLHTNGKRLPGTSLRDALVPFTYHSWNGLQFNNLLWVKFAKNIYFFAHWRPR